MNKRKRSTFPAGTFFNPINVSGARTPYARRGKYVAKRARVVTIPDPYVISRRSARVVNPNLKEKKYFDALYSNAIGTDMAAAIAVNDLCIIAQGNTVSSRVGKKIQVTSVQVKAWSYSAIATASAASVTTYSLVWDREPDKAALVPTVADVYQTTNPGMSLTNRDNAPRFKILRQFVHKSPMHTSGSGASDENIFMIDEYIDLRKKNLEIIWTKADTAGSTANKVKGNLLWVINCSDTIVDMGIVHDAAFRVDYADQ